MAKTRVPFGKNPEVPPEETPPKRGMKRSRYIALAAVGVIGASFLLPGKENATDEAKEAALYADVDECVRANVLGRETCESQFRAAQDKHVSEAPKFGTQNACEAQYGAGQCKPAQANGASVFVPAMIGFMVGNYLSNARNAQALMPPKLAAQPCPPGVTPQMQPGCAMPRQPQSNSSSGTSSSSGASWRSYSTASGDTVSRTATGNGTAKVPSGTVRAPGGSVPSVGSSTQSSPVSRGGFGATAHSTGSHASS